MSTHRALNPDSPEWIRLALPTLTNAEAFKAVARLAAAGYGMERLTSEVLPHLPRLATALRTGEAAPDNRFTDAAAERLAAADYAGYADPLLEAAADHAFVVGDQLANAVVFVDRECGLNFVQSISGQPEPLVAQEVARELQERDSDRFAVITRQFALTNSVDLLFGCPTGRTDVLRTRLTTIGGTPTRGPWEDPSPGLETGFIHDVMRSLGTDV